MGANSMTEGSLPHSFRYDSQGVAERYDHFRRPGGPFMDSLLRLARESNAKRVLELGPGTGNNTLAFLKQYPCSLIAVERSPAMLERLQTKFINAHAILGDANHLPCAPSSVEFIFGVLVLHHIESIETVFEECHATLSKGYTAFVTSSHEFIDSHPLNRYFQSFATIDKARFPSENRILDAYHAAGFSKTGIDHVLSPPVPIDRDYVEKIAGKFISTFDLIPDDEFRSGLARLQQDVKRQGQLDVQLEWKASTVWAKKT